MDRRPLVLALSAIGLACLSGGLDLHESLVPDAPAPQPVARMSADEVRVRGFLAERNTALTAGETDALVHSILDEAERSPLALELILAVIHVESSGRNFVESRAGAIGLMQLRPSTAEAVARDIGLEWRGPKTLLDPVANVRLGVAYLERLVERFGDIPTAIAAYNEGPTRIAARLRSGRGLPVMYTDRVLQSWESNLGRS